MKKGYCNGSDMLVYLGDEAAGHCTSHKTALSSETTEHAVKPPADKPASKSLFKEKTVTGLSISVSADGLIFYGETEASYAKMFKAWKEAQPITIKCMERGSEKPYLKGAFIIESLERNDEANTDSTYSIQLSNTGAPDELDETAFEETEEAA